MAPIPLALDLALGAPGVTAEAASAGPAPDLSIALQSDGACSLRVPIGAGNFTPFVTNDWTVGHRHMRGSSSYGPNWSTRSVDSGGAWRAGVYTIGSSARLYALNNDSDAGGVYMSAGTNGHVIDYDSATHTVGLRTLTSALGARTPLVAHGPGVGSSSVNAIHMGGASVYSWTPTDAGALWWRSEFYSRVLTDAEVTAIYVTHPDMHPVDAAAAEGEDVSDALVHIYQAADRYDSGGGTMVVPDQWGTGGLATLLAGTASRFIASAWPY